MACFEIKDLTFEYPGELSGGKPALRNIDLEVEKGQYVVLCGKSGSGKTTLLKHLKSVLAPHGKLSGKILFDGKPVDEMNLREQSSRIGFVMQNPDDQIVTDKVWHELAFGLESLGMDQKTMRLRVAEMSSYFGIQDWFHKDVSELSGGQKQLLNLASIMAMQPEVLILDEPTSQLDPIAASDFLNTVRKINSELRTTVIITEHRLEDVLYAADRVVVMDEGKIAADDIPSRVGELLQEQDSQMFTAMPAPMRIYYSIGDAHRGWERCPLTVREGGDWLSSIFAENSPQKTYIDETDQARLPEDTELRDCAIAVKEAWFRYDKNSPDVLRGLDLKIPPKCIYAIVGGNGTGKSTALKAICNICKPYRGKVYIDGKQIDKYKGGELFHKNLAMLPQDPQSLFVKKTVLEDLREMLPAKTAKKAESANNDIEEKIADIAALCEITGLLDRHPYDLSGGEQQRAALAKVLLTEPRILLMDEPTKGIDNFFKIKFARVMRELKERGVTIVMVSHDVEFCAKYADIVSMFFDGSVITTNTARRFFSQNSFYTTAANRMSRHIFKNAVTDEDVATLCDINLD